MRGAVVLRPEPADARTAALLDAFGIAVQRCPLFAVRPVGWDVPDPACYDAILLTSANAARHAGSSLALLTGLPVLAVGRATAASARTAGLHVALTGDADAAALVAQARARGWTRLLHLAGRDRIALPGVDQRTIYVSEALPIAAGAAEAWRDHVVLLHSARAARRFGELVGRDDVPREAIAVAALSKQVAEAADRGWAALGVAAEPTDAALVDVAAALIDRAGPAADKRGR